MNTYKYFKAWYDCIRYSLTNPTQQNGKKRMSKLFPSDIYTWFSSYSHIRSLSVLFSNFMNSDDSVGNNGISIFFWMLRLQYLDHSFEEIIWSNEKYNRTQKKIMKPLSIKGLQRYFPPNCKLSWDVKIKIWDFGKIKHNLKTETGTPF